MNKEETGGHLPDSDESDDDFCPENAGDSDAASEDESAEDSDADAASVCKISKTKGNAKRTKKKSSDDDEDETEDDSFEEDEEPQSPAAQTVSRRSTRQTQTGREKATLEKEKLESDDEDKTRTDALWADFLSDVKQPPKVTPIGKTGTETVGISRDKEPLNAVRKTKTPDEGLGQKTTTPTPGPKLINSAILSPTLSRDSVKENKLKSTSGAAEASTVPSLLGVHKLPISGKRTAGGSTGSGLGSILNQIGKKKKISVLEKSQSDWTSFKQDEGIDEELQTFNKGKDGYLERQDFLQRTDLRQFEIEKNLRKLRRNNN